MRTIRIFVSSPGDAHFERQRLDRAVERLNGELVGTALFKTVRWENSFYSADSTFQKQIPEASDCDIVVAILRHQLGTELPKDFATMPGGDPYPSGSAYEILSAIAASKTRGFPDVYVFRSAEPLRVVIDDPERPRIELQWRRLKEFFDRWFLSTDGRFTAAFHTFKSTDDFEVQAEQLLRSWLEKHVLKGRAVVWPIETKGSPFRGLKAFGARHAPVFFGRSRDIERSVDAWKQAAASGVPFLLVVGPSGAGKSSLARAGLVPRLTAPGVVPNIDVWRVVAMRPGEGGGDPFAALSEALLRSPERVEVENRRLQVSLPELAASDYRTPSELADLLAHADAAAAKPIVTALDRVAAVERAVGGYERPLNAALLLLVDQFDELFASDVKDESRAKFASLLLELGKTGRVWLLATLRADFYEQLLALPELTALKAAGATYDLVSPGPSELAAIIREPARASDLVYEVDGEGRSLDERLLADADRADMLPLLQFTLDRLFDRRSVVEGHTRLTHDAYDAIGGLDGAIDHEAERAVRGLGESEMARLPRLFRDLVVPARADERGADARNVAALTVRATPLSRAAHDEPAAKLIRALVDARILLSSDEKGFATIRVAHQRVLGSWKRVQRIVVENADFFRIRDEVEGERLRWEASGRKRSRLIRAGVPLAEAESIARTFREELPPETRAFITASANRARLTQRVVATAAILFLGLAVAALYLGVLAQKRASAERTARQVAQQNFGAAKAAIDGITTQLARGLRDSTGMRISTVKELLSNAEASVERLTEVAGDNLGVRDTRALMLLEFGWTYMLAGDLTAASHAIGEALALSRELAAREPENPIWKQRIARVLEQVGSIELRRNGNSEAMSAFEEAIEIDRKLLETSSDPNVWDNLAICLKGMGEVHFESGNSAAAIATYNESLGIFRRLAGERPEDDKWRGEIAGVLDRLGDLQTSLRDLSGALASYQEGERILRKLIQQNPNSMTWRRDFTLALENIGRVMARQEEWMPASQAFREGLENARALSEQDPLNSQRARDVSNLLEGLGQVELALGEREQAFADFGEALDIRRRLVELDSANLDWRRGLPTLLVRICRARLNGDELEAAQPVCAEALHRSQDLLNEEPYSSVAQGDLAVALAATGDLRRATGDLDGALSTYSEALARYRQLAMDDPNNEEFRRQVAITLSKMATTEYRVGDAGDALSTIAEAVAIRENLLAARPTDEELQKGLLGDLIELGTINIALGDRSAALDAFRKSLELSRDLHERAPVDAWRLMKLVIASGSVASLADGDERAAAVSEASETLSQLTFGRGKTEEEQIWHELLISLQEQ